MGGCRPEKSNEQSYLTAGIQVAFLNFLWSACNCCTLGHLAVAARHVPGNFTYLTPCVCMILKPHPHGVVSHIGCFCQKLYIHSLSILHPKLHNSELNCWQRYALVGPQCQPHCPKCLSRAVEHTPEKRGTGQSPNICANHRACLNSKQCHNMCLARVQHMRAHTAPLRCWHHPAPFLQSLLPACPTPKRVAANVCQYQSTTGQQANRLTHTCQRTALQAPACFGAAVIRTKASVY